MPTSNNRKIISLAALSEFKDLLTQDFNGRYVPYYGAESAVNLGANDFLTEGVFEARNVSNNVINSYTRYRAGGVVVSDASALNTKIINFPAASALSNSNTFATQEWGLSKFLRLDIGGTLKGNIDVTPETANRYIAVNSPTNAQSSSYAMLRTYNEDGEYYFGELVLDGFSGTTKYRRDYIQIGNYKLNFPTLSSDKTLAISDHTHDDRYLLLSGGTMNGNLGMSGNKIDGANEIQATTLAYGNLGITGDLTTSTFTENDSTFNATVLSISEIRMIGSGALQTRTTYYTFKQKATTRTPKIEHVASEEWVNEQGYTNNTGTVTSVTLGVGTGLSINSSAAITSSGTRTISIASGYKLPTTTEWNEKANVSSLGTAAYTNTGIGSGNVPVLDSNGKLSTSVLPALAITDTFVVSTQAAMLALSAQVGDICVRTDLNKSFILKAEPASTLANWQELLTPTDAVTSVNGQTGPVTFAYLSNAIVNGQTLTITKSDGTTVSLTNTNTNYYHKTGSWNGLTYTAGKVGSPDDLVFTIPTGTTASTVSRGDHTHTSFNGLTINTQTDTTPLIIQRSGSNAESVSYSVNDAQHSVVYTNDEVASSIKWTLVNTDTEGSDGSRASTHYMQFIGSNGGATLNIDGTAVSMQGHTHNYAGSSSAGGAATSALKLSNIVKIGDTNQPVYFNASGVPVAISYTIEKSVPSNAVFTDTHNTHKIISGYKQDGTTQIISANASNGNIELGASGITAGWYKRVYVNAKGIVVNGDQTDSDANTWRNVQVGGVEKLGTGTGTGALNFVSQNTNNGDITFTYDGGIKATAKMPSSLKNPNAIKIQGGGADVASYDGSAAKTFNFAASSTAGAFTISDGTTTKTVQLAGSFTDNNQTIKGNGTAFSANDAVNILGTSPISVTANTTNKTITIAASDATTSAKGIVKLVSGDLNGKVDAAGLAASQAHTHSQYLPLSGGQPNKMTGILYAPLGIKLYDSAEAPVLIESDGSLQYGDNVLATQGWVNEQGYATQVKIGNTAYNPTNGIISLPSYPSVSNATITIKQTGKSDQTFTLNGAAATITLSDNNTTYSAGTGLSLSNNQFSISAANVSTILNLLSTGSSDPTDDDYYISQYVGGGTTTTTYHRRPVSKLYNYMKGKMDSVYQAKLTAQTAYSAKGSATKVPQITTNSLGQVTSITEVTITQPTVNNASLTLQVNGTTKTTFYANDSTNRTFNITAADLGLSAAMKFLGTSATAITDGSTTNPITIGTTSTTAAAGNVVLYGSKEFVWTGSAWEELGNEGSYALSTVKVEGTGALSGGGNLTTNRTITHNAGNAPSKTSGFYKFSTDAYSHVNSVTAVVKKDLTDLITSMSAASGGTDLSLVTTGEKYTWNNKSNLALVSSGGNNGSATTAARSDHTHALATRVTTDSNNNEVLGQDGFMSTYDKTWIEDAEQGYLYVGSATYSSRSIVFNILLPNHGHREVSLDFPTVSGTLATEEWASEQGYTALPQIATANKLLLSTATSGTVKWSDFSSAGFLKTNASGVISVDTTSYVPTAGITAGTGKSKLGVKTSGSGTVKTGEGYLEVSNSAVSGGTTTYYRDKIVKGSKTINLPTPSGSSGTLALTSDITSVSGVNDGTNWTSITIGSVTKNIPSGGSSVKLWLHTVIFEVANHVMKYEYYSTSNANISLADLCDRISNMVFGDTYGGVFVCKSTFSGTHVEYTYYGIDGTFVYISSDRVYITGQTATEV